MMNKPILRSEIFIAYISNVDQLRSDFTYDFQLKKENTPKKHIQIFLLFFRLCCQCGVPIAPNPANTCVACIRTQVDITADIPKQMVIYFCRFCERCVIYF